MEPLNAGTQSFAIFNNRLIISGGFTSIGGIAANGLAAFDGSVFTPMTLGRIQPGGQLLNSEQQLYITGGLVGTAGQMWSGNSWVTWPGTGTTGDNTITVSSIYSIPSLGVLAEGTFAFPAQGFRRRAIWNGSTWLPASTQWGPNTDSASITDVQEFDGSIYVSGSFDSIARGMQFNQFTVPSRGICIFEGSQWREMPRGGLNGTVRDMVVFQDQLFLAGEFTATRDGSIALNRIARFDGTTYHPVSTGSGVNVTSMCVADDGTGEKLFLTASALIRYNGTTLTFLPILHGLPLISKAYDPGFGMGIFIGGSGLRTNLVTQNGSGLIRWGPAIGATVDTDGDGLPDSWETTGIDGDCNGTIDLNLAALGANPLHKDIFVEVDSMQGRAPAAEALIRVETSFALAPVSNPDTVTGINLHIITDPADQSIPLQNFPNDFDNFHPLKSQYFGNPADRASPNRNGILTAKQRAFRYCMFANLYGTTTSSGLGEFPGNDFMVTLGGFIPQGGTPNTQASTFMHEMGHTLGLHHGGDQVDFDNDRRYNYKPNYHSVMNYSWQLADSRPGWTLDYSRVAMPSLDETALDEIAGLGGTLFAVTLVGSVPAREAPEVGGVDWNRNNVIDTDLVTMDANHIDGRDSPSPSDVLQGSEDWSHLVYNFRSSPNYASGSSPESTIDIDNMTAELAAYIDSLYSPTCLADFNSDATVDFFDYLDFVAAFADSLPGADFNGDSVIDFFDYLDFVAAFAEGC